MRSYHRQGRQTARRWLRWLSAGRVQADDLRVTWALWAMALAIVWAMLATPANAAPACPHGHCTYRPDRLTVCAWPMLLDGERVAWCVRTAEEVQP
jgi:hypothetical protein